MKSLSRVVWTEGMYLGPHHFQAQGRYFEDSLQFAVSALWFRNFGVTGLTLDADALENGTVSVVHARGIFPDGLLFHMPESDPAPEPRAVADAFSPTAESLMVMLAAPERRPNGPNVALTGTGDGLRYIAEQRSIRDEVTGGDERKVATGRKNIRLLFGTEPADGMVTLPIARVRRGGAGQYVYDPSYVPPCLEIASSETLMMLLRRLIEIMESKSATLGRAGSGTAEMSTRDIASFWLLHAVNSALAPLRHIWVSRRGHPEYLFIEMSRLAGALCTFALQSHPGSLAAYDHLNLGDCFTALDQHIRAHLETIVPTNCISIRLTKVADYFYEGDVNDTRCFGRSRWIFGVRSAMGEAELIQRTPQLVKICSAKFVAELVRRAMAGLALTHMPIPPAAVPVRLEYQYFSMSKEGPFWDHIVQTRRIGVYVPGELPEAEMELLVVVEQ